ncbi:hypothetical protein TIFTF001_052932 [Ficus carica]|uniref:Uncharacterized protein n=1 Tax=Ficus carica TaxID=3494 RepID=A0AA88EDI9_FICCA|nr:hypothetical protein TIFTF001_052925 [Ficus carica]GMN72837.1 hypothetical protein TIFTF001_052928 [Ficus carica]GMN72842.1 hypothetical protein TIFTF001_052929 [Ficus carica]GMN72850.1 hypothetical protein TIFTF001_052932 [Ficus carica]
MESRDNPLDRCQGSGGGGGRVPTINDRGGCWVSNLPPPLSLFSPPAVTVWVSDLQREIHILGPLSFPCKAIGESRYCESGHEPLCNCCRPFDPSEARPQRLWKCDLDITARFVSVAGVWTTRPFIGHGLNGTAAGRDLRSSGRRENEANNNVESVLSSSSPVTGRR